MRTSVPTSLINGPIAGFLIDPWGHIQAILHAVGSWVITWAPIVLPAVVILGAGLLVGRRWWSGRCQAALHHDARVVTVLAPPTVDPHSALSLWSHLTEGLLRPAWKRLLFGQPHVAFEYVFSHDGVHIRFWVPGGTPPGMIENAVASAWPGAQARTDDATPPLPTPEPGGHRQVATGGCLRLARSEALPIPTEFSVDPLRQVLGAAAGLGPDEHACVQVLARPATGRRLQQARYASQRLHDGQSTDLVNRILDVLTPGPTPQPATRTVADGPRRLEFNQQDHAIAAKQVGSQWDTVIRYAVTTTIPAETPSTQEKRVRQQLRGRADGIASGFGSAYSGDHNRYGRHRLRNPVDVVADRRFRRGDLLCLAELAAVAHVPTDVAAPGLHRAGASAVPPPPDTPSPGAGVRPLGISDTGHARPVGLRVSDARHHLHVLGATGSGKSTLLAKMVLADADAGRGAVVIDPKGDLVTDILARLPEHAADKVVLFDPETPDAVPCLNPLEGDKDMAVDNLVSIFSRVYASSWGHRSADILRSVCLTLRAGSEAPTLADLLDLLTNDATRGRYRNTITDPALHSFWDGYERQTEQAWAHATAPLLNKLRPLLLRSFLAQSLAAGPSTVDMGKVLDGGLCLVRVPKGRLGEDNARLFGSLVVAQVWQAATARAYVPQWHRRDAALYVDEAHNFLHMPIAMEDMLAEARGYRLSMILAHQHLGQLSKDVKEGISTNARSKAFFTCSPEDARELARHTAPRISDYDLANLGRYQAAARLVVDGAHTPPFTLTTQPLPRAIPGRAEEIRAAATRHTQPRSIEPGRDNTAHGPTSDPRRAA